VSKQHRDSNALEICSVCGRKYTFIKHAMRTCGAVHKGLVCGGELRKVEKREGPK
jgi:hypothetical protein